MREELKKAMAEARQMASEANCSLHCAESWLQPREPGETRSPTAMMRKLLRDAEGEAELALQFIRQAQEALPKRGK